MSCAPTPHTTKRLPAVNRRPDGTKVRSYAAALVCLGMICVGCGQRLDIGHNITNTKIPNVDFRNPVIMMNDNWGDNWSGEYAALLANHGGPALLGIIINASKYWPDLDANESGWKDFVIAARESKLQGIPDATISKSTPFIVPPDRKIESTQIPHTEGARRILELVDQHYLPWQRVVILACTQLTDIAAAFLLDPTIVERTVVISQLGAMSSGKGIMTGPNGDLDPWADWIVAQHFYYVQISAFYDHSTDITQDDVPNLPRNRLGEWIAAKIPMIARVPTAADQAPILAMTVPDFISQIVVSGPDVSAGFNVPNGQGPPLVPYADGNALLVTQINGSVARKSLWKLLSSIPGN